MSNLTDLPVCLICHADIAWGDGRVAGWAPTPSGAPQNIVLHRAAACFERRHELTIPGAVIVSRERVNKGF